MLIIRLIKVGKKNSPAFRVVITQKTAGPKSGSFLEVLGSYNPRLKEVSLKKERIEHWLSKGAQVSDTVHNLLIREDVIKGDKIKKKIKAKKKVSEEKKEEPKKEKKEKSEEPKKEEKAEETKEEAKEEKPEEPKKEESEENLDKSEPESKIEK